MVGKLRKIITLTLAVGLSVFFLCPVAETADFPTKPVRIIVTADVGGGEDNEARGLAPYLQKHLGVNVTIENMGTAGGKVAFEKFQKIEPDGYNLIFYTFPKSVIIEMTSKTAFRTKDYTPVHTVSNSYNSLFVNADNWKTFDEFLKAAKARTLSAGLSGRLSISHLAGLLAVDELGIKVNWVPFDGAAGSLASLAGKHIDLTIGVITTATSLMQAGKVRCLMMFGESRDPYFPDVPIPKDLGYTMPSIPAVRGLEAPPNTSPAIVKVLEEACAKALKEPAYMEWTNKRKTTIFSLNAQEYGKLIAETYPRVGGLQKYLKE
ncbi:MAG: tripartite tricarboxylate transporter substrate binding protein [Deltaproteobacteria bacterium]